jgi:hypothetical protein
MFAQLRIRDVLQIDLDLIGDTLIASLANQATTTKECVSYNRLWGWRDYTRVEEIGGYD